MLCRKLKLLPVCLFLTNVVLNPQLVTLRGSILEDAVASTGKHGTVRGLKEVLEQVVPELNVSCLRLALSTAKVTEQLLKLDEQGVSLRCAECTEQLFQQAGRLQSKIVH